MHHRCIYIVQNNKSALSYNERLNMISAVFLILDSIDKIKMADEYTYNLVEKFLHNFLIRVASSTSLKWIKTLLYLHFKEFFPTIIGILRKGKGRKDVKHKVVHVWNKTNDKSLVLSIGTERHERKVHF